MINKLSIKSAFGWAGLAAIVMNSSLSYAQEPVTVTAIAVHYGGNIQYTYKVTNHTKARTIVSVSIGNAGKQPPDPVSPSNMQPELSIYPAGSYWGPARTSGDNRGESPRLGGIYSSPLGWAGKVLLYGETDNFSVDWNLERSNTRIYPVIQSGQTFSYGVTVPLNDDPRSPFSMSDPAYLNGHFTVGFDYSKVIDEGPSSWNYTGSIVSLDTKPPTLSISLSPSTLWPPNDKLVPITATITASDDFDPQPEIKLESITATEMLATGDVQDAQIGMDDRSFSLIAKRAGTSKDGRIYTVTYSATDASGNKAIASATVTVPHDQGK